MSLAISEKESPILGTGSIKFLVKCKGKVNEISLGNVLYNPNLRHNLLSGVKLNKAGAQISGGKGKIQVYDQNGTELFEAKQIPLVLK